MKKPEIVKDDTFGIAYYNASEMDAYIAVLESDNAEMHGCISELQALFDLQHTRVKAAEALWRKAHPGKEHVTPDLGELVGWLMDGRVKELESSLAEMVEYARDYLGWAREKPDEMVKDAIQKTQVSIDRARALLG
jgi:hypothetical protein